MRTPDNLANAGSHTTLKMYFRTTQKSGMLAYIGPDKTAQSLTVGSSSSCIYIYIYIFPYLNPHILHLPLSYAHTNQWAPSHPNLHINPDTLYPYKINIESSYPTPNPTPHSHHKLHINPRTLHQPFDPPHSVTQSDYMSLQVIDGKVKFQFSLGSGSQTIVVDHMVNDGQWREVVVDR